MLELVPADYSNPEWPNLAEELYADVHKTSNLIAIEPTSRLVDIDKPGNKRKFMVDPASDGAVLGITSFGIRISSVKNSFFISEIFVPRSLRGQSYGRRLLELTEQKANLLDVNHILLQAIEESVGFYMNMGYQIQSEAGGTGPFMIKPTT